MINKITTLEMELALVHYINHRQNVIVPNIQWGMNIHECDLFIVTKAGYAKEIEIKVDKYDLLKDKQKKHKHYNPIIKELYFAIPDYLLKYKEHIPDRAGIYVATRAIKGDHIFISIHRNAERTNAKELSDYDKFNVARLGTMRIWGLKAKLNKLKGG